MLGKVLNMCKAILQALWTGHNMNKQALGLDTAGTYQNHKTVSQFLSTYDAVSLLVTETLSLPHCKPQQYVLLPTTYPIVINLDQSVAKLTTTMGIFLIVAIPLSKHK